MNKLLTLKSIVDRCREVQEQYSMTVGLCHGCWDILHIGHIRHLQLARTMCNGIIVTVTSDRFVNKGNGRPVFPAEIRAEVIAALSCVSFVAINDYETAAEAIRVLHPDIYFKGLEFKNDVTPGSRLAKETHELAIYGGKLEFIGETLASSTATA